MQAKTYDLEHFNREIERIGMDHATQGPCQSVCVDFVEGGKIRIYDDWAQSICSPEELAEILSEIPDRYFANPDNYGQGGEGFWNLMPFENFGMNG